MPLQAHWKDYTPSKASSAEAYLFEHTGGLACPTQAFPSCQEDFSLHEVDQFFRVELSLDKACDWLSRSQLELIHIYQKADISRVADVKSLSEHAQHVGASVCSSAWRLYSTSPRMQRNLKWQPKPKQPQHVKNAMNLWSTQYLALGWLRCILPFFCNEFLSFVPKRKRKRALNILFWSYPPRILVIFQRRAANDTVKTSMYIQVCCQTTSQNLVNGLWCLRFYTCYEVTLTACLAHIAVTFAKLNHCLHQDTQGLGSYPSCTVQTWVARLHHQQGTLTATFATSSQTRQVCKRTVKHAAKAWCFSSTCLRLNSNER